MGRVEGGRNERVERNWTGRAEKRKRKKEWKRSEWTGRVAWKSKEARLDVKKEKKLKGNNGKVEERRAGWHDGQTDGRSMYAPSPPHTTEQNAGKQKWMSR